MTSVNNSLTPRPGPLNVNGEDRINGGKSRPLSRSTASGQDDSITLTITGTQIASSAREMASTPAFDMTKVERLKTLVAEGQYSIDPQKIADRLMALEMSIN